MIELQALIDKENASAIDKIVTSLRSPTGVIPFIGAGMSHDYGVPMWGQFLELAAVTDDERVQVKSFVKDGKYEDAAQLLDTGSSREKFRGFISEMLDVNVEPERRTTGPLSLLPLMTTGPVITTNFDRVIEAFYETAERPFSGDAWIAGRRDPLRILDAIQQNRHALIKLHGDVQDASTFTFTALEYDESYGSLERGTRGVLTELGNVIYTNRPLLFLGCSLEKDRTLAVLQQVASQNRYLTHYAVLAAPKTGTALEQRRDVLKWAGIVPLWFMPGQFEQIAVLLDRLLERATTDDVNPDAAEDFDRTKPPNIYYTTVASALQGPKRPSGELTEPHIRKVARAIAQGELSFFLGAGVHHGGLLGNQFYKELSSRFKVSFSDRNRAYVAEQLDDLIGKPKLSDAIADMISSCLNDPWLTHKMITSLAKKPPADAERRLIVFTTNYDDVLERTLAAAGVAYHLILYQPDGPHAGRFLHRSVTGRIRVILDPMGMYKLDDAAPVVVKLNGGLDPLREVRGRFAVTSRDFIVCASRIPAALPRVIRHSLRTRSLLFLGHGLLEANVREFARYARKQRRDRPSWAVLNPKRDVDYWLDVCGVEIREADLDTYLMALHRILKNDFDIDT
ncbi:MAG: SIR2 family protein [Nitrospira sp.]